MTPQYLNLKLRAPFRLADLKQKASALNAQPHRKSSHADPVNWRDMRHSGFRDHHGLSQGLCHPWPVWATFDGPAFPRETWADEVEHAPIDHSGWYADPDGDNTYRGFVVALPRGRFLAGYYISNTGERVYFPRVFDDARGAACWADGVAQQYAKVECAYQERWREARDLEDDVADNLGRLREALALRNHKCFPDMRRRVAALLERIREVREKLANDYADVADA